MAPSDSEGPSTTAKVVAALLAGFVALLFVFPASGVDTQPPQCFSIFNYAVPCDAWVSWAVAAVAALLVVLAQWLMNRRR